MQPQAAGLDATDQDKAVSAPSSNDNDSTGVKPYPFTLADIRKAIPPEAFEKDLSKSLFYLFFDYAMWGLALFTMWSLVHSPLWQETLPWYAKCAITVIYWNIIGFFMWCIFVVGHDCGHKTFSVYPVLNDIIGHLCHGSIAVPYYPWQLSHHFHHLYHNHVDKDFSYLWFPPDILAERPIAQAFHASPLALFLFPFYGYFMYLIGMPDGSHYIPSLPGHRLWEVSPATKEAVKCIVSTASVIVCLMGHFYFLGGQWSNFAFFYAIPLLYFSWWLVTVTYLQHHHEESVVFDDHDWQFLIGGLETVDRTFGFGIDALHHHITDGHVVHHLFFTQIPHYNLMIATRAMQSFLAGFESTSPISQQGEEAHVSSVHRTWQKRRAFALGREEGEDSQSTSSADEGANIPLAQRLYKHEQTHDFMWKIHWYLVHLGFHTKRASPKPVATKDKSD